MRPFCSKKSVQSNPNACPIVLAVPTFGFRSIEKLDCSKEFIERNFALSEYIDPTGRKLPKYVITQDGFAFLAFGYTGKDASRFKEMYIGAFNEMSHQLNNKVEVMSERKALIQSLRLTAELAGEMEEIKDLTQVHGQKLIELESKVDEQITLDSGDQRKVQKAIARKIYTIEGDQQHRSPLFRQLHREIKDRWAVPSYKDVRKQELDGLMNYIEAWRPIAA